jgi:type II secretory ATPase GspE/PulE/Tfp pilus assembly ATPase PilB-like protein
MSHTLLLLGEGKFLVSFWKPVILLIPFVGWAWVISRVYDKHALRFHLGREKWNVIHLVAGLVALAAGLLMPIKGEAAFWVGLPVAMLILGIDLFAYPMVANKDDRVPEAHHIKLNAIATLAKAREEKAAAKKVARVELKLVGPDKSVLPPPQIDTPEFELRAASEGIVLKGMGNRASQVDVAPSGRDGAYGVSYLIDGMRPGQPEPLPSALGVRIIDFWKNAAKLDVNDRRRRLSADITAERGESKTRLRVQSVGATGGQRMTILFDPEKQVRRKSEDLGLLSPQLEALQGIVKQTGGLVLLSANADQGRTTTLYSVLRMHDAYTENIQTVELEPQDALEGVRQNQFEATGDGPEYATFLRSILRRDPQVVGVAEMPDEATAKEIAKADFERTRIYLSLRTESAMTALQAYVKAVGDADLAGKGLRGAVAQKLMRSLCTNCRVPYAPSAEMLKQLGIPAGKVSQLYKKGGQVMIKNKPEICPVCQGVGYHGQVGVFEVFAIDSGVRSLVSSGNLSGVLAEFRKKGYPTIRQAAISKVASGVTSVEELSRITAESKPSAPAAKPGAKPAAPAPRPKA